MSKKKIETVLNFPLPKEVTALRGFLGVANYFRQFVPFHSEMVKPLHMMVDPKAVKRSPILYNIFSQILQWRYDTLQKADSFQNVNLNKDCGFHILNFIHAALRNARIPQLHETFNKFKARTEKLLNELQNPAQTQSTSSSCAIITELTQIHTRQEQSENTPQAQLEDTPQE